MTYVETLEEVAQLVRRAGERILATPRGPQERKYDGTLVTRADLEANHLLREQLPRVVSAAWLSEESAESPERLTSPRVWIVDPLDGTKEFVDGLPEYAVSVALVEQGQPVLAVVHNPVTQETFCAARGCGAFRNGSRLRVGESERLLASRSECRAGEFDAFPDWTVTPVGSIAYKLALVAAGEAAVTFSRGPKHEWDVCAGALLVIESGGLSSSATGEPLVFNKALPKTFGILAGAPKAHERARVAIERLGLSTRMAELHTRDALT